MEENRTIHYYDNSLIVVEPFYEKLLVARIKDILSSRMHNKEIRIVLYDNDLLEPGMLENILKDKMYISKTIFAYNNRSNEELLDYVYEKMESFKNDIKNQLLVRKLIV